MDTQLNEYDIDLENSPIFAKKWKYSPKAVFSYTSQQVILVLVKNDGYVESITQLENILGKQVYNRGWTFRQLRKRGIIEVEPYPPKSGIPTLIYLHPEWLYRLRQMEKGLIYEYD